MHGLLAQYNITNYVNATLASACRAFDPESIGFKASSRFPTNAVEAHDWLAMHGKVCCAQCPMESCCALRSAGSLGFKRDLKDLKALDTRFSANAPCQHRPPVRRRAPASCNK